MYKIIVGKNSDRLTLAQDPIVESDDLAEAIQQVAPLHKVQIDIDLINKRTNRYPVRFKYRKEGKFEFYEAVATIGEYPNRRYVVKRISVTTEDKTLYVDANAPWVMYNKSEDVSYVQFDFITDALADAGWTEDATDGWHKAKQDKNGLWIPFD